MHQFQFIIVLYYSVASHSNNNITIRSMGMSDIVVLTSTDM